MGPAPTRLPRMAFPPPGTSDRPFSVGVGLQQAQGDDASEPDGSDTDGESIQVPLRNGRSPERAGHTAAEHVGQSSAAALVEQHEYHQQTAGDHEQDGEDDGHEDIAYVTLRAIQNRPAERSGP